MITLIYHDRSEKRLNVTIDEALAAWDVSAEEDDMSLVPESFRKAVICIVDNQTGLVY